MSLMNWIKMGRFAVLAHNIFGGTLYDLKGQYSNLQDRTKCLKFIFKVFIGMCMLYTHHL